MSLIIKRCGIAKTKEFIDVEWANITSIFALIFIFGKSVLIPKKILGSLLIVLIFTIGSLAIVPYYFSYAATTNLSLFLISSFIYGSIFYSFRKSTLFDNINETNLSKFDIYLSIFAIMFIFTAFAYLFIISFFIIGLVVDSNLFMTDWFFENSDYGLGGYAIKGLNVQLIVWWYIAFISLNFSLFYLFQNIAKNQKTFYLFVFFYFFIIMIYGNALIAPSLDQIYVLTEKYSFLNGDSTNNLYQYVGGFRYDYILLIPNKDYPIDASFYIEVRSDLLVAKFKKGNYFVAFMTLLTPYYWINFYSADMMKATCLSIGNFNPKTTSIFPGGEGQPIWDSIATAINDYGLKEHTYLYAPYGFKNAKIWSLQNDIGWILGMYLWTAYFVFFYFVGRCISKFVYYKN